MASMELSRFCFKMKQAALLILGLLLLPWLAPAAELNVSRFEYLLGIDRLQFYSYALADQVEKKNQPSLAQALRALKPEAFLQVIPAHENLKDPSRWDDFLVRVLATQGYQVSAPELQWNYNFLKNKLVEAFTLKAGKDVSTASHGLLVSQKSEGQDLRVPELQDTSKVLLEVDRYVSEKTTRAFFWEASESMRAIELHVGTEQDFRESIERRHFEILYEVSPPARNYNRLYVLRHRSTGETLSAISSISGEDRIRHFIAQMQLTQWRGSRMAGHPIRLMSSWVKFHDRIQERLSDQLKTLPRADLVVIGQKGAIESGLQAAWMTEELRRHQSQGTELSPPLQRLLQRTSTESVFSLIGESSKLRKELERIYEARGETLKVPSPAQFTIEHPSHEFSDYLVRNQQGEIRRLRVFSAVWGDEILPIARSLKASGQRQVTYIGTAGALPGKGLHVGDLVSGGTVQTHEGQLLSFAPGHYAQNISRKNLRIGQVRSPYFETENWLKANQNKIDVVEVETGALRQELGKDARLQAYFLISDVIGVEGESLAAAAQNSGRRKTSQLRLLESLFQTHGFRSVVFDNRSSSHAFDRAYDRLLSLKPNRDPFSLVQLSLKAVREGLTLDAEFEQILKSEPNFNRKQLIGKLSAIESQLQFFLRAVGEKSLEIIDTLELEEGLLNPKRPLALKIRVGTLSPWQIEERLRARGFELRQFESEARLEITMETEKSGLLISTRQPKALREHFEKVIYRKNGMMVEVNSTGDWRLRRVPQAAGGWRCEAVLL